jgi:hypothetical protein
MTRKAILTRNFDAGRLTEGSILCRQRYRDGSLRRRHRPIRRPDDHHRAGGGGQNRGCDSARIHDFTVTVTFSTALRA